MLTSSRSRHAAAATVLLLLVTACALAGCYETVDNTTEPVVTVDCATATTWDDCKKLAGCAWNHNKNICKTPKAE